MGYQTTLEDSGKKFEITSLTRKQAKAHEALERQVKQAGEELGGGELPNVVDSLLAEAYPEEALEGLANRDILQIYRETVAYTWGAPIPEKNS